MREALRINPYPPPYYEMVLGRALYFAGDTEQARGHLQRAVELDPNDLASHVLLSAALSELGEVPDARRQARQMLALAPEFNVQSWISNSAFVDAARVKALKDSLGRAACRRAAWRCRKTTPGENNLGLAPMALSLHALLAW